MKVVVVGAGEVGYHLARTLSWEGHEVVIIDTRQELVDRAAGSMDVMALRGNGTSVQLLVSAGVRDADLLVAVTSVDEVNIVACMLAKQLNVKTCIARVRNQEYSDPNNPVSLVGLGIDQIIHPELEAAKEVVRMIMHPQAIDVVECASGKIMLVGMRIDEKSDIIDRPLDVLTPAISELSFRLVSIIREGNTIIPRGKDIIKQGDAIYAICHSEDLPILFKMAGKRETVSNDIMLLGGGMIGRMVAEMIEGRKGYNIKLIEGDEDRSNRAVQRLKHTMVIKGGSEGIDFDVLALEGIDEMGVFAALTDDDENNIVTSLFARHLGVKRTVTLISKPEYIPIIRAIGLDAAVNERIITSDAIIKYLLGSRISAKSTLQGIDAEIIEFSVVEGTKVAGKRVRDIHFPEGSLVGAIERNEEAHIAVGDSMVLPGDHLVVFCQSKVVPKLNKLFH